MMWHTLCNYERSREQTVTTNQSKAILLAHALVSGATPPAAVPDADWHLLLLAAGVNSTFTPPGAVALQVLERAKAGAGYFTPREHRPRRVAVAA
jgi:hypothetical protein